MKRNLSSCLLAIVILACSHSKNLAQTKTVSSTDSLIQYINDSRSDTNIINPKLKQLQQENDLVISLGLLNYAWLRRGSFYVLALHNHTWQLYRFDAKLPPSADDASLPISPREVLADEAEKIKELYAKAQLWKTEGDTGENFCSGKKDCNITDAETWTLSVATRKKVHTTSYYATEFFEECCPGNPYRKAFINLAKSIMELAPGESGAAER